VTVNVQDVFSNSCTLVFEIKDASEV